MQRDNKVRARVAHRIAVCTLATTGITNAWAQDAETLPAVHVDAANQAQPLITLPSTPTPSPVNKIAPMSVPLAHR